MISGRRFRRQPLEKQEIEFRRLADEAGQQRMDLAAVVGLVIKPVRQRRRQRLLEFLRRGDPAIPDGSGDPVVIELIDVIDDATVFGFANPEGSVRNRAG